MGGNFKAKCLQDNGFSSLYTIGKIYEIENGIFENDCMEIISVNEIEDLNGLTSATWKLIEEEGENKVEDLRELLRQGYVVVHIDDTLSKVEMNSNEELVISGNAHWCLVDKLTKELYGYNGDPKVAVKEIYGHSDYNSHAYKVSLDGRDLIWKREEEPIKSPTQLEIESIELEQRKLADRLAKLKEIKLNDR